MTTERAGEERTIDDDFGSVWRLCERADCDLQVVRPGKVQCRGEWEPNGCPQVPKALKGLAQ